MKTLILAGGHGTRISEESHLRPKPMVEIGGAPILLHIMRHFSRHGHNDFVICAGYKQEFIKEYFANYYLHNSDVTFDFAAGNRTVIHNHDGEPWRVTVVNTGLETMTGGRVRRVRDYIGREPFFLTYGDGVSDVDLEKLLEFHKRGGAVTTITSVQPAGRFGILGIRDDGMVTSFAEKIKEDTGWINGGYMVCEPELFDYIEGDGTILEHESLERLAAEGKLAAYKHDGFWQCMDTLRDKEYLESLITKGAAPWIG
jgi:glucose-1-phosphate cytidylyltransferase